MTHAETHCLISDFPDSVPRPPLDPSYLQKATEDPDLEAMRGSGLIM